LLFREAGVGITSRGVYCTLQDSLTQAVRQLGDLELLPRPSPGHFTELQFELKDGCDGAGNQLKIKGCSTGTMELMGYVILNVKDITDPVSTVYSLIKVLQFTLQSHRKIHLFLFLTTNSKIRCLTYILYRTIQRRFGIIPPPTLTSL